MQIQVAKALGAEMATTIGQAAKAALVRSVDADLFIATSEKEAPRRKRTTPQSAGTSRIEIVGRRAARDFVKEVQDWTTAAVVVDNLGGAVTLAI